MYVVIAGGGKVGANVTRTLIRAGHEVTLIEQRSGRFAQLETEFEHQVQQGDATELYVLERAGIGRPPDLVVALTGDDEDNLIISQIAKERYGVPKTIARVNDPRNQAHFDLLGISPTICATTSIMALIEHEVPEPAERLLLLVDRDDVPALAVELERDRRPDPPASDDDHLHGLSLALFYAPAPSPSRTPCGNATMRTSHGALRRT